MALVPRIASRAPQVWRSQATNVLKRHQTKSIGCTFGGIAAKYAMFSSLSSDSSQEQPKKRLPFVFSAPVQDYHQIPVIKEPSSHCSSEIVLLEASRPPRSNFKWPDYMELYARRLHDSDYDHMPNQWNPYLFITYCNHERGREVIEWFGRSLPQHPLHPKEVPELLFIDEKYRHHPSLPSADAASSVSALVHCGPFSNGPPGLVHGGLIASIQDMLASKSLNLAGRQGVTAALNIQYKAGIPVGQAFIAHATCYLTGERKAKISIGLFSHDMKTLYAEGEGIFVTPRDWVNVERLRYGNGIDNVVEVKHI